MIETIFWISYCVVWLIIIFNFSSRISGHWHFYCEGKWRVKDKYDFFSYGKIECKVLCIELLPFNKIPQKQSFFVSVDFNRLYSFYFIYLTFTYQTSLWGSPHRNLNLCIKLKQSFVVAVTPSKRKWAATNVCRMKNHNVQSGEKYFQRRMCSNSVAYKQNSLEPLRQKKSVYWFSCSTSSSAHALAVPVFSCLM